MEILVLTAIESVGFFIDKMLSVVLLYSPWYILYIGLIYTSPTISHNFHDLSMEYWNSRITGCHGLLLQTSDWLFKNVNLIKYVFLLNPSSGFQIFQINPNNILRSRSYLTLLCLLLSYLIYTSRTVLVTPSLGANLVYPWGLHVINSSSYLLR